MGDKNHPTVKEIFQKKQNMVLRNFLDEKVYFLHVAIVLTCFQSEKKSQNKLDLRESFLMKRLTKLVKFKFRGWEAKKSHLGNFPFSFYPNLYQSTI